MTIETPAAEPAQPVVDIATITNEAVRPWREKVRVAERRIDSIREALVERFKEETLGDLTTRRDFNEFLSELGLKTIPRTLSGEVELVIRRTFQFEDIEIEDGDDVDDAVQQWLEDEDAFDRYDWDVDSMEVNLDSDSE